MELGRVLGWYQLHSRCSQGLTKLVFRLKHLVTLSAMKRLKIKVLCYSPETQARLSDHAKCVESKTIQGISSQQRKGSNQQALFGVCVCDFPPPISGKNKASIGKN